MRVRLKTIAAGPAGVFLPGERDVPEELGRQFAAAGFALLVDQPRTGGPAPAPLELATAAAAPATATAPEAARKRRGGGPQP